MAAFTLRQGRLRGIWAGLVLSNLPPLIEGLLPSLADGRYCCFIASILI